MNKRAILYTTENNLIAVDDQLSLLILDFLKCKERNFKDIILLTKKAKSSINLKLTDLEKKGLIQSRIDPEDRRKRFYSIDSIQISSRKETSNNLFDYTLKEIEAANNSEKFMTALFKSLKYLFNDLGINIEPVLKKLAQKIGMKFSERIKSNSIKPVLKEIASIYKDFKLGRLEVISLDPLTVSLENSFECRDMPCSANCLSTFDTSFIQAILEESLHKEVLIKNKHCKLKEKKCLFEIWSR